MRRFLRAELAVFGMVGAVCLLGDIAFFNIFAFSLGMSPLVAKSVSMLITGTIAFFGHRHLTFRGRGTSAYRRQVSMFVVVTLVTVVLSLLPLWVVRHIVGTSSVLWLNLANLLGIALGTAARYAAYRELVWTGERAPSTSSRAGAAANGAAPSDDLSRLRQLEMEHELIGE
jgi:putative flippase GtrA